MTWRLRHSLSIYSTTLVFFFLIFVYFWLCWVFVSVRRLSLVAASGGHPSSRCAGLSLSRSLSLRSTGSRRAGSVVVAHGPSCSAARGILPDQGSNSCPLHWQADSQPLHHQGSPTTLVFKEVLRQLICYTSCMSEDDENSWETSYVRCPFYKVYCFDRLVALGSKFWYKVLGEPWAILHGFTWCAWNIRPWPLFKQGISRQLDCLPLWKRAGFFAVDYKIPDSLSLCSSSVRECTVCAGIHLGP